MNANKETGLTSFIRKEKLTERNVGRLVAGVATLGTLTVVFMSPDMAGRDPSRQRAEELYKICSEDGLNTQNRAQHNKSVSEECRVFAMKMGLLRP